MKKYRCLLVPLVVILCFAGSMRAENNSGANRVLSARHQHIASISALTARGDLVRLHTALTDGLDAD